MADQTTGKPPESADEELELLGFDESEELDIQPPASSQPEAFGHVLQAEATRARLSGAALADIPEAVVVEAIPEAMPIDQVPVARQRREIIPTRQRPRPQPSEAGQFRRIGNLPVSRNVEDEVPSQAPSAPVEEIDPKRFLTLNDAKEGRFRATPLERDPNQARTPAATDGGRAKFLDGELPRSVERGVTYPDPFRLFSTALVLVIAKLLMIANAITIPIVAFWSPEEFGKIWWLPASFAFFGLLFLMSANKARCKVCTCHLFFKRNCLIHNKAHKVPFLGAAGSAALHVLLFKWLRCMYCGTAIRLRKPSNEEKAAIASSQRQPQEPAAAPESRPNGDY